MITKRNKWRYCVNTSSIDESALRPAKGRLCFFAALSNLHHSSITNPISLTNSILFFILIHNPTFCFANIVLGGQKATILAKIFSWWSETLSQPHHIQISKSSIHNGSLLCILICLIHHLYITKSILVSSSHFLIPMA